MSSLTKQRIRSAVRVRPVVDEDYFFAQVSHRMLDLCVSVKADKRTIVISKSAYDSKQLEFDAVFLSTATQSFVYETCCADIVRDSLGGYNGSIILYGQTGTHETRSIFSSIITRMT